MNNVKGRRCPQFYQNVSFVFLFYRLMMAKIVAEICHTYVRNK
jgi:hypothetical protein